MATTTAPAVVRAPGAEETPPAKLELDAVDALAVGHSLRALAQRNPFPTGETAKIYRRVGEALVAAAYEAIKKSKVPT